ncbi:MAG: dienelactone hydrolase family protein [Lentimicrobium sp.]|jgi:predicted peptidase|nr:dienelactone hydrolase family protein [Lentimicrobium sp.]
MKNIKLIILLLVMPLISFSQEVSGSFTFNKLNLTYNYLLHKTEDSKTSKPLIVFLHGSGERGVDVQRVKIHGPLKYIKTNTIDAYILAPQCPENEMWNTEMLYNLINDIVVKYNIDTNQIHLTGLSMGGWGTWNLAFEHPEMFASVVPICGFVDRIPMLDACKLKNVPVKIYHGLLDDVVNVFYSVEIYKKMKACNANVSLTIFDDANHDSWTRVYDNEAIYQWMLKQKKK